MKNTMTKLETSKYQLDCEVESKVWKDAQEKAFRKLAAKVSLPGFRPGKAPLAMLRAHVDPSKVLDTALNDILNDVFVEAVKENKLRPLHSPEVEITKVSDSELGLRFVVVTTPDVTLGAYTGLKAERKTASVTDEEVSESISKLLENNADLVVTENPAKKGDTVILDFEGFVDGKAFDGGKADNYSLELGSNSFIPGFEDALVGIKAGESRDVNVTFPEQYVAELAGKAATFKCLVHEVKEKVIPVLSDESVEALDIENVKTVEQLKAHQKETLLKQKVDEVEREHYTDLFKQIVDGSTVEIAEEIIADEVAREQERTKKQVESNGLTFKQYLDVLGKTEEALRDEIRVGVVNNLKNYLVSLEIGAKEHLLVDDAELDHEIAKIAEQYSMSVDQVKAAYGNNLESLRDSLNQRKLQEYLLANNQ